MKEGVDIKLADQTDLEWVNEQYRSIRFGPSVLGDDERVLIAVVEGNQKVGVGRLVRVSTQGDWELGGIFVQESSRGQGIARVIVQGLCDLAREMKVKTLWCVPFEHLLPFYSSFGLETKPKNSDVPCKIRSKLGTCGCTFPDKPVALMKMPKGF